MKKIKEMLGKKRIITVPTEIWILLGISFLLMSFTLFQKISWGNDYPFHFTNILASISYLKENFIVSKIVRIAGYNFGYGTYIFYPSFSHLITILPYAFLKLIGLNLPQTMEITKWMVLFLSGVTMYFLVKKVSNQKLVALVSAVSYMCAPYFLSDIYVRCAYAEIFTFIFMPLILHGLYELFYGSRKKFYLFFVIGYVGMMCSHLVITVYFTFVIGIILLWNIKKIWTKKCLKPLFIASVFILLFTSPFYIPMLEHKLFGNYVVFGKNVMTEAFPIYNQTLSLGQFFMTAGNKTFAGMHFGLNIMMVILFGIALFHSRTLFKNKKPIFYSLLTMILFGFLLISRIFPWKYMPNILTMIQFPWRLLSFLILAMSVIAGFSVLTVPKEQQKLMAIISVVLLLSFGISSIPVDNITFANMPTELEEWGMGAQHEYLPVNAKKHETEWKTRDHDIHVQSGKASIQLMKNNVPNLKANIKIESDSVVLELPRFYYFGYQVKLKTKEGKVKTIKYRENDQGFIDITLKESGELTVTYPGTIGNQISNLLAFIALIGYGALLYQEGKNCCENKK